ncbi:BnaAnng24760D [Brassica napus]|uniref:DNA topoisomerase (ATP-hydrolyzing) n=2 Tax=Brassica TaxID=3705 RepID=A0A078JLC3_BRANA|nr:BnaAnng24760D [Brassica napus]
MQPRFPNSLVMYQNTRLITTVGRVLPVRSSVWPRIMLVATTSICFNLMVNLVHGKWVEKMQQVQDTFSLSSLQQPVFQLVCLICESLLYMPIIPTVLVNSCKGIGTGWSTFIPNYNTRDIVANIRRLLNAESMVPMDPWYMNFKGTIEKTASKDSGSTNTITGVYEEVDETTIRITELPIRRWTDDYKNFMEALKTNNNTLYFQSVGAYYDDTSMDFQLQLSEENMMMARQEEVDEVAPAKGGRKPAAASKVEKPPAAPRNRAPAASKKQQLVAEVVEVSSEKKVRKMRSSLFNKKSSLVLGRLANTNNEEEVEEQSVETVAADTASARPKRAKRKHMRYVPSDSESESANDSEFDEDDEDYRRDSYFDRCGDRDKM